MRVRIPGRENFDYSNKVRSNDEWHDHRARTLVTASLIAWCKPESALDIACGDGSILSMANRIHPIGHIYLNDISTAQIEHLKVAAGFSLATAGAKLSNLPAEDLLTQIEGKVDVVVMTEILEHVEDPDLLLRLAADKATYLIASSPEMRPGQVDSNPEHMWQFDGQGYEDMLNGAGWRALSKTYVTFRTMYDFQIWVCERG